MKYPAVPAYARVTMAAFLWGTAGVASRLATPGIPAAAFAEVRLLLGGIALALLVGARRLRDACDIRPRGYFLLAACALAAFQWSFFAAVAGAGAARAALLSTATAPVVAGLLTAATQRTKLAARWWVAAMLGGAGSALMFTRRGTASAQGIGFAVLSGALYAVFTWVTAALETRQRGGLASTALALLGAGFTLAPAAGFSLGAFLSVRDGLIALYLGLATTAWAYGLYVTALRVLTPTAALAALLWQPVTAVILGVWVLHEPLGPGRALAAACLVCSMGLLTGLPAREAPSMLFHP
ncbi:MAG: DMT family transporter [Acidiferrobacteraceae bacterium]